jgi:hypothetical protein
MPGMVRLGRAFASLLVVFGMLGATWATCVEGAIATSTEQMACCEAGYDHCPMKGTASDCCKTSGPQVPSQGTIVNAASFSAPLPVVLTWMILTRPASAAHLLRRVAHDASPPGLLYAPPAYIAFSALLL